MSTKHGLQIGLMVLISVEACAAQMVEVAPDQTPLLFDRLRAFSSVVVAATPEGFEKSPAPVKGTNCVYLPVQVETVLKGDLKPSPLRLDVHERLPALLALRDKETPRRYLLAVQQDKKVSYLGGGMVYTDLARFYLTDAGMKKTAKAFVEANDVSPAALVKLCNSLLADKDVAASACAAGHVCEVLARLVAKADAAAWKTLDKAALQSALDHAAGQLRAGVAVDAPAAVLNAAAARQDNPEGVKVPGEGLGGPARKWLAAQLEASPQEWSPDYQRVAAMTPVVNLLGRLKDQDAKDLLVKQTRGERWSALRRPVLAAFKEILSPEDRRTLAAPPNANPPPGLWPGPVKRIDGPLPPVRVDD